MEYRLATNFKSGQVTHRIENERLVVEHEKSGRREEIPYAEIREINLRQELHGVFSTWIVRKKGRTIVVPARHFIALGRFEDRGAQYVEFVQRLHEASSAANPQIRFTSGSNLLFALGGVLGLVAVAIGALLAYAFVATPEPPRIRVVFAVPVALVVAAGFLKQGRAKVHLPSSMPVKFLPALPAPSVR